MIDEIRSGEEFKNNEILHSLIPALEANKPEIQKVVENLDPSQEHLLEMCLEANDDLNKTTERYDDLKRGKRPKAFSASSKCIHKNSKKPQPSTTFPSKEQNQSAPKSSFEKFGDFGQAFKDFRETPSNPKTSAPKKEAVNLLDFNEEAPPKQEEQKVNSSKNKAPNTIDDFLNMNEDTQGNSQGNTQKPPQETKNESNQGGGVNLVRNFGINKSWTRLTNCTIKPVSRKLSRSSRVLWEEVKGRIPLE